MTSSVTISKLVDIIDPSNSSSPGSWCVTFELNEKPSNDWLEILLRDISTKYFNSIDHVYRSEDKNIIVCAREKYIPTIDDIFRKMCEDANKALDIELEKRAMNIELEKKRKIEYEEKRKQFITQLGKKMQPK